MPRPGTRTMRRFLCHAIGEQAGLVKMNCRRLHVTSGATPTLLRILAASILADRTSYWSKLRLVYTTRPCLSPSVSLIFRWDLLPPLSRLFTGSPRRGFSSRKMAAAPGGNHRCRVQERRLVRLRPAVSMVISLTFPITIYRWVGKSGWEWRKPRTGEIHGSWFGRNPAL